MIGKPNAENRARSPFALMMRSETWGLRRSIIRARIGRPASGNRHLSPPPMRLDLPPASNTPTTTSGNSILRLGLETRSGHVPTKLCHGPLFSMTWLDLHGAIFVSGNLRDRIELRIGEYVSGR